MSTNTPSLRRKTEQPWDQILLRIIQVQGPEILTEIVRGKVSGASAPRPEFTPQELLQMVRNLGQDIRRANFRETTQGWARFAAGQLRGKAGQAHDAVAAIRAGWDQLRHGPHRREPLEKAAIETLSMAGFVGGFVFGMSLPQIDLKLSAKGEGRDSLILHAAALMATETAAEWIQEVLRRALLTPSLGDGDAKFLRAAARILTASTRGMERGWTARQVAALWIRFWRSPLAKQHRISTDAQAVRLAQELIERLRR